MQTKDWWYLIATVVSPFLAAGITAFLTLAWQRRSERHAAKEELFLTLMEHRKANPPSLDWVNAMNLIEVIFAGHEQVIKNWQALYNVLNNKSQVGTEIHQHTYLNMLSEMANALGYKKLQQTDIDKFYSPQVYATQAATNAEMQALMMEFFKNLNSFITKQQVSANAESANAGQATIQAPLKLPPPKG